MVTQHDCRVLFLIMISVDLCLLFGQQFPISFALSKRIPLFDVAEKDYALYLPRG